MLHPEMLHPSLAQVAAAYWWTGLARVEVQIMARATALVEVVTNMTDTPELSFYHIRI